MGPSQAMDLLQLAESQGHKYTTLNNVTSPRARSSPGSHHDNISPRLVHQIVSHNQWVAGERPGSPKQSPGHPKASGESDSNDSANDGSGKDKRFVYFSITSLFCHTPFHFIRTKIYRVVLRFILTLSAHSWEIFAIVQAGSVLHFLCVFMESGNVFFFAC